MPRAQQAHDQIAGAHLRLAEHQRREHPAALDGFLDVARQIRDRVRAARQPVERFGDVARERRRVHVEVPDDAMQIGVLQLQNLMDPVREFDIRIATQLAEHGGAFDAPVGKRIELAEQCASTDFGHGFFSCDVWSGRRAATRLERKDRNDRYG